MVGNRLTTPLLKFPGEKIKKHPLPSWPFAVQISEWKSFNYWMPVCTISHEFQSAQAMYIRTHVSIIGWTYVQSHSARMHSSKSCIDNWIGNFHTQSCQLDVFGFISHPYKNTLMFLFQHVDVLMINKLWNVIYIPWISPPPLHTASYQRNIY